MRSLFALGAAAFLACACTPPSPTPPVHAALPAPSTVPPAPPAPALVHIRVLALNDFHGNLAPPHGHDGFVVGKDGQHVAAGGAAYLAAHIKRLRAENPNTIVVSAGDLTGASPLVSSLFGDEPTVLVMNRLGLDVEAVGNHDFDRGIEDLRRLQMGEPSHRGLASADASTALESFTGARYQYLAANVFGTDGRPVFPPYLIKALGGVNIAVVGMTLEGTPTVTAKESIKGLTFAGEASTANALLPELREHGVAATVLLVHQGGFQNEKGNYDSCNGFGGDIRPVLGALDPSFRVVVTAHTHQAYDCVEGNRVITSAGSYGRLITVIDLTVDPARNEVVEIHAENIPVTRDIEPDPVVTEIVARYEAKALPITSKIVGFVHGGLTRDPRTAKSRSCETPLGDVVADAQLAATRGAGAVLAFVNPGGVRTDLTGQEDEVLPIHFADAFEVQPFSNRLITLTLSGGQIRSMLERQFRGDRPRVLSASQGFSYTYKLDAATKAVTVDPASIKLDGRALETTKRYRVTVNSFLADGGDGFTALRDAPDRVTGALDIDAFVTYLETTTKPSSPLTAPKLGRITGNACE